MNFFTLPWYTFVFVILAVMAVLYFVYRKPPGTPEGDLSDDDLTLVEDLIETSFTNFTENVVSWTRTFRTNTIPSTAYIKGVLDAYKFSNGASCRRQGLMTATMKRMLKFIGHELRHSLNDNQMQEVSLTLIQFCEEELMVAGLNTEAFRHRNQVSQSARLLEMCVAILKYFDELDATKHTETVASIVFARHFNANVVHDLYARAMSKAVQAKRTRATSSKDSFHKHNREQRARRLQRQARERPKTN